MPYRRKEGRTPIVRAFRIYSALKGFQAGMSLQALADEVEASPRTVDRDLNDLELAGFSIERTEGKAWARLRAAPTAPVFLNRTERFTVMAIARVFDVLAGTPFHTDVRRIVEKLRQRLAPKDREEQASMGERFVYLPDGGVRERRGKGDLLNELLTGVLNRRIVEYRYADAKGRTRDGRLAPYTMLLWRHGLYVLGRPLGERDDPMQPPPGGTRAALFLAERFVSAKFLPGQGFVVPADFRPDDYVQGAFGPWSGDPAKAVRVVIEFSAAKAAFVRDRIYHPRQKRHALDDGRVRLEFPCHNIDPVVSFVLSWGPHAIAIEPQELVDRVVDELDGARAHYPPAEPARGPRT